MKINPSESGSPLRVLVISSTYPRHSEDYAVPWMRETHRRLKEKGHEITVLAPSYKGLRTHQLDDIEVVRFRYAPKMMETLTHEEGAPYKVRKFWTQLLAIPYLMFGCLAAVWLAMTRKFDVVHVHWPFPHGIMGQLVSLINRAPLIVMCHGAELALARRKRWIRPFLKQSLQAANIRLANSSDTARQVTDLSEDQCVVVPYGTTVRSVPASVSTKSRLKVLFTGRLIERKGLEYLIKSATLILKKHDVEFVITGDGDQKEKLLSLRDSLGLQTSVKFVGFLSKEELAYQYASCNVWVNPGVVDSWGDAEGLGIGSIEAYNNYKPVVATSVGGIPDTVINGVTGFLVPERDSIALANAICNLLGDPSKAHRFGRAGFLFARDTFSWDRIIPLMVGLYRIAADPYKESGKKNAVAA